MFCKCTSTLTPQNYRLQLLKIQLLKVKFHTSNSQYGKNAAVKSQAKILGKLFGERVTGSKKRWYPTPETNDAMGKSSALFSMSKVGVAPKKQGKNTTRRMAVLNKLFMEHISDLLANSDVASNIQGRGLQVTSVKITSDFGIVNVYWMGNGEPNSDLVLEKELQHCSGLLRHQLSQLYLMGHIPRINFVRDRANINSAEVEALLRDIDFGDDNIETDLAEEVKRDFKWKVHDSNPVFSSYLNIENKKIDSAVEEEMTEALPEMRYDVLGLDHRQIMLKILTKMRKSKQAWELHEKRQFHIAETLPINTEEIKNTESPQSAIEDINKQLMNATIVEQKFDKFLAKRRERKHKMERYRNQEHDKLQDLSKTNALLEKLQNNEKDDEDFIEEEEVKKA